MAVAIVGVVVMVVAVRVVGLTRLQWRLIAALAAWMIAPAISMVFLGSLQDVRFWWIALIGIAVGFAGVIVSGVLLRRLVIGLGWFYGWGSVAVGVSQLLFEWPLVLVGGDERYARWLTIVGISVDEVPSLNGLTPGRLFLAMNCAVILVVVVRWHLATRPRWYAWLMPLGLVLALAWSFGRVGIFAVIVGLVAAVVPWERGKPVWAFLAATAVVVVPVALSQVVTIGDNTGQWRFDLWGRYLGQAQTWAPFGLGPQSPVDPIRGHAHNQIVETLASGGWVGIFGLLAFVYFACVAALRVRDNRATIALVFAMCGIFATDVLTLAPSSIVPNSAFAIVVSLIVAAGSPAHMRLLREPAHVSHG